QQQGPKLVGSRDYAARQGSAVGISGDGDTLITGGPDDYGIPTSTGQLHFTGAAWIFHRVDGAWFQEGERLVGSDALRGSVFGATQGASVALSGDGHTALVGGPRDSGGIVGAVWVFVNPPT